jgi:hypothetical protein
LFVRAFLLLWGGPMLVASTVVFYHALPYREHLTVERPGGRWVCTSALHVCGVPRRVRRAAFTQRPDPVVVTVDHDGDDPLYQVVLCCPTTRLRVGRAVCSHSQRAAAAAEIQAVLAATRPSAHATWARFRWDWWSLLVAVPLAWISARFVRGGLLRERLVFDGQQDEVASVQVLFRQPHRQRVWRLSSAKGVVVAEDEEGARGGGATTHSLALELVDGGREGLGVQAYNARERLALEALAKEISNQMRPWFARG